MDKVDDDTATAARQQIKELRHKNPDFTESELEALFAVLCTKADAPRVSAEPEPELSSATPFPTVTATSLDVDANNADDMPAMAPQLAEGERGEAESGTGSASSRAAAICGPSSEATAASSSEDIRELNFGPDERLATSLLLQEIQRARPDLMKAGLSRARAQAPASPTRSDAHSMDLDKEEDMMMHPSLP
ncbi:hypothetical protein TRAPUB_10751 [Trametes pubescens]|uniref:Uncharacterized protein n=1 Tax=Trametes pubescens TaxID=154538 RepID=A0A1M2VYT0_TRAPU|nr:hypothetical protein TRAPUB_10751 [Trametes pubescens]